MRAKTTGSAAPTPPPPWLAGVAIGLAILGMAGTAMAMGAVLAFGQSGCRPK